MKAFLDFTETIEDPRVSGMIVYPLNEIMLVALVGILCGGDDWDEIDCYAENLLPWLRGFLPFRHGIAPPQTCRRLFARLPPRLFEACFMDWAKSLLGSGSLSGVVAIDGKSHRGTRSGEGRSGMLHVLSAWACDEGLVLGQCATDTKSNEITAIPELLRLLELKGAIVSIDAMGTQKAIASLIVDRGADWLLALKGNQRELHDDVRTFFNDPQTIKICTLHEDIDAGHGRVETRNCLVTDDIDWLKLRHPEWVKLRSIVRIQSERYNKKTAATSQETRFYITSLPPDAAAILAATRAHWGIENKLHWQLDVTFREDASRMRKDYAARNLALIRKAALNILRMDKTTKASLKRKRIMAAVNHNYRLKLISC
jgi:predicted transposase YbfD/YdcC